MVANVMNNANANESEKEEDSNMMMIDNRSRITTTKIKRINKTNNSNSSSNNVGYYQTQNQTVEWYTPLDFYQELNKQFNFTTDPCAEPTNRLGAKVFFTKETDGLDNIKEKWKGSVFINPPYTHTADWVKAAVEYNKQTKNTVCMLLKATTDVQWFHQYIYNKPNIEIRFCKGRFKFTGNNNKVNTAPFPSMVVIIK
jgi:site-specific DNA-methyltransferase (adenine-specific)